MASQQSRARSWRVHTLGTPAKALRLDSVPVVSPGPDQVRVAVRAIGLNHPDLLLCSGHYQERPDPPFSPGFEAAGIVVEVGDHSQYAVGEHVIVVPELPEGAMQESLTVTQDQVYPAPEHLPFETAAVLYVAYATAHAALHRRARLRPGETLVVSGAAGGVGTAAVQLGLAAGARVVALASGPNKTAACRRAGADVTIDLQETSDLVAALRTVTDGQGADVVVDVVGGSVFDSLRRVVAFEGRLVTVGFTSGDIPTGPVNHVLLRNYSLVGLHLARYRRAAPSALRDIHDDLIRMHEAGLICPPIHARMPFEQAPQALDLLGRREAIGRVVLRT